MDTNSLVKGQAIKKVLVASPTYTENGNKSFFSRLFGFERYRTLEELRLENAELASSNQRNIETIRSLSDKLASFLSIQQNTVKDITEKLKIIERIPEKQEDLHQKIMDSFDRASFYVQTAAQDLIQAKSHIIEQQNDNCDFAGTIEMAEFMRTFLVSNLLLKQIKHVNQLVCEENANVNDIEQAFSKLQKNISIVNHQTSLINFKLEKFNLRIENSLWRPFFHEMQTAELVENCSHLTFHQVLKYSQSVGLIEDFENVKSIVTSEIVPAILIFNKEKLNWEVKRKAKVVLLKPQ